MRVLVFSSIIGAVILGATSASAQNAGFTVNRYEPSERGSHWFVTESLDLRGELRPALGVVGDYQYRPLAIYDTNGDVRASIVRHMFTAHVGGSLVFADRFRLALSLPVVPYVEGEDGRLRGVAYAAPANETTIGDLRVGIDARLFGRADEPITVGVGAQAWLPTGDGTSYTSDGNIRFAPRLLVAGTLGIFAYAAKAGVMIRAEERSFGDATVGHDLMFGASAGVRIADGRWVIGPELFGTTTIAKQAFEKRTTPLEILLGTHYAFEGGLRVGAGIGPGLTRGYGSPVVRALAVVEWTPDVTEDKDGDGIPDREDACPDVKGVRSADPERNGCPAPAKPADRDGDGILDVDDACPDDPGIRTSDKRTNGCGDRDGDGIYDPLDACPAAPGIPSEDPKLNGCPDPDRDKDGVPNAEDACPDEPGVKTQDPKTNGCPDPDRDKDGIPNAVDACPDEPGKPNADPKKNGCPQAFVSGDQIVILEQVKFKTASAEILPGKDSEEVLQAVLKVLKEHPEITKVRVEGHTDNKGTAALNKKLSGDRAASVVKWLTKNGIDKARLSSEGFGQDKPIDTNATDAGRQNNRRVEFHIESGAPTSGAPAPKP
jgi:OmpA-OmpF porin, OOP family